MFKFTEKISSALPAHWSLSRPVDETMRPSMRTFIFDLLKNRPDATPHWLQCLVIMCERLEAQLWVRSQCVEDYENRSTVARRIKQLAIQSQQASAASQREVSQTSSPSPRVPKRVAEPLMEQKAQRLLLLDHCKSCHDVSCNFDNCATLKPTMSHILSCKDVHCSVPMCLSTRFCSSFSSISASSSTPLHQDPSIIPYNDNTSRDSVKRQRCESCR
jgi:hypothetical protein